MTEKGGTALLRHFSPRRVRAWYGMPAEIVIEGDYWHLVQVGNLKLPHPPVVNLFIRRGLSPQDRLQFSHRHEFGHLQTLPLALFHLVWLFWRSPGLRRGPVWRWAWQWGIALLVHEAVWEMASEGYVMIREGERYRRAYRARPNLFLVLFWMGLSAAAWLGTRRLTSRE